MKTSQQYLLMFPIMAQNGAGVVDRLPFSDEKGVNGLVSTGCFGISMELWNYYLSYSHEEKKTSYM